MPSSNSSTLSVEQSRLRKVQRILISQPPPQDENSPYLKLAKKYNVKIDFIPFIKIHPISLQEFYNQKVNIEEHSAVIFTSRNAQDHFFRLIKESKKEIKPDMKYFCVSKQTANYLQKHIAVRKRKVFTGNRSAADLLPILKKHKQEKYLFPCSDLRREDIPNFLQSQNIYYKELIIYRTCSRNLSHLSDVNYDVIAFFSPSSVGSLLKSFPNFEQEHIRIAAFGPTTAQAVRDAELSLDIEAPLPNVPSMAAALEHYIQQANT